MRASVVAAVGLVAAVTTSVMVVSAQDHASGGNPPPNPKWFVCKFVQKPGENEQLQSGRNPISVSENAIPISPVFVGAEFADAQGRSVVIAQDVGQPEPSASECPPPNTTTTTTTTTPTTTTSTTTSTSPTTTTSTSTSTTSTSSPTTSTTSSTTSTTVPGSTTSSSPTTSSPSSTTSSEAPTTSSPRLVVDFLTPICDGDVPYLGYSASFPGATSATITFINPSGEDVVYSDLPLSGRVLWPGAVVDAAGNPLDWPGWTEVAPDVWVEGDEFDWVRPSVTVILEVNPSQMALIGYPPSTPQCSANPPPPPGVTTTTVPGTPPGPPAVPPGTPGQPLPPTL